MSKAKANTQPSKIAPEREETESPAPQMQAISEQDIAQRAYALYLAQGGEDGHDVEHWLQAESELREAISRDQDYRAGTEGV
jgi:hypothetical protein